MSELRLEPGDAKTSLCDCCGTETRVVNGYVYEDNAAHAIYLARWTDGHPERGLALTVSVGGWGGGDASQRWAIACEGRRTKGHLGFVLVDEST